MAKIIFVMTFLTTQNVQNFASYFERQDNIENAVFVAKNALVMTEAIQNAFLMVKYRSNCILTTKGYFHSISKATVSELS